MDDQGAGGSSRGNDPNPGERSMRESSLPPTLRPHLYHAPRHASSQRIAPLIVPDWPNQLIRSRSQGHGRSLPSPSSLLGHPERQLGYEHVILSRSLDASPVNPPLATDPDLPPPRLVVQRPPAPVYNPPYSGRDHSMGGHSYPPGMRSLSTSPYGSHTHSHPHVLPYGREPTSRTPQPPQPTSHQARLSPGIQDVFMEDVWVLPQPQPQQPARFSQLLSGPGYQGGVGASSSSQSTSSSRSQTIPSFAGELYSEGQSEIKPFYQGSSMGEPLAIETQEAASERKKAQRSSAVKRSRTPAEDGASTSQSVGTTASMRRRPATKVTVACNFCRGRKLRCDGKKPCSNCSGRGAECAYQPGGPRRRGPGKAPKKAKRDLSRQQRQQQHSRQQFSADQSQMSISADSPGPSGPSPITIVPTTGIIRGRTPLTLADRLSVGPRFPSQSPGASTSEMETGSQAGSKRRLSGSSVEEPERKRSRIREFGGGGAP